MKLIFSLLLCWACASFADDSRLLFLQNQVAIARAKLDSVIEFKGYMINGGASFNNPFWWPAMQNLMSAEKELADFEKGL